MNIFKLGLLLLTASSGLAYEIDEACKDAKYNGLERRLKYAVQEAKLALGNAADVAQQCKEDSCSGQQQTSAQLADELDLDKEREQWCGRGGGGDGDMTRRLNSVNLVQGLLGDESINSWQHVYDATNAAKDTLLKSTDQSDKAKIYCGDSAFTRVGSTWIDKTDKESGTGRSFSVGIGKQGRPCDANLLGLAMSDPRTGKKGIMLCDKLGMFDPPKGNSAGRTWFSGVNQNAAREEFHIDALADSLSAELIHEMIHLGDMNQFPLEIAKNMHEKYKYKECKSLAGDPARWKNCDTFANIARGLYMNSYYSDGDMMKRLPDALLPDKVNTPTGVQDRST